jgi:hypothetical protein
MTWGRERQIFYLGMLIAAFLFFGFLIIFPYINRPPTCTDGVQNGTETGADCGGSCKLACFAETDPISVMWSRSFRVVPGRYNAVAYLVNHNQNKVVEKINYRFRFADENNVYIGKREGSTFVPPAGKFTVFESAIDVGNSTPVYTSFEFTSVPTWIQVDPEMVKQLNITLGKIELTGETTNPHLSATIKNNSLFFIPEVGVVAILYDAMGNAVSVSRTFIDSLSGQEAKDLNFTWPEPFTVEIVEKELMPLYNLSLVKIR